MSVLAALARACARLPDAPPFGFSTEKIGFCIVLNSDGMVAEKPIDLRDTDRKRSPRALMVPQAVKRTAGISPNFLWDKSAYVLGVTAGEGKRTAQEHAEFRRFHEERLAGTDDDGLLALLRFLSAWTPEAFAPPLWPEDLLDQNLVFALASERRERFLHDRPAARALWERLKAEGAAEARICLVTGDPSPVARLHPSVKGVWGAQSSGASLVSFNLDAFASYGHEQGENAPVSEAAAFAYTTALNRFLERDSGHRIQIGDASTVFWAEASEPAAEAEAETLFAAFLDPAAASAAEDAAAARRIGVQLKRIREGRRLDEVAPHLPGVRFHVIGFAPNAARLSIRFAWADDFGRLTANYQRFLADTHVSPPPRDGFPPLWRWLLELAAQGKRENVPPTLAGDWMRSILAGTPYPLTLLTLALVRIRADGRLDALRAGMMRAVLVRNFNREVPVALDPDCDDRGYLLGRLFAVYEEIQRAALGGQVNATIRDKFYGSASATPQKVFSLLDRGSANHLQKLRKLNPGRSVNLEKQLAAIMERMSPGATPYPVSLPMAEQALFGLGYYHQRSDFFRKRPEAGAEPEPQETVA
ncbi:type I-C CRISPR-associated protein Cas8c/Csd1 [uncultured Albimonas sp.]|uniref:type I-C CRISPR-associated protein Cas8c/Csd1 n=1 Tax=uncultured Albimonas sp. TaxID=1331701 RepID=UPI0030EE680C|tara:strand:+ start:17158 stop:18921 length:1764 start_codon:yes stop_codon:yes gene_type:complete